jgi:hypothetical protein
MVRADEVVVRHEPTVVVHEHYAHHYTHHYAHHDVVVGMRQSNPPGRGGRIRPEETVRH